MKNILYLLLVIPLFSISQRHQVHFVEKDTKVNNLALYFYSCNYNQENRRKKIAPSILAQLPQDILIGCLAPNDYYIFDAPENDQYLFYVRNKSDNVWKANYIHIAKENDRYYVKPKQIYLVNDGKVLKVWEPDIVNRLTDNEFIKLIAKKNSDLLEEVKQTISNQTGKSYTISAETEEYIAEVFNEDANTNMEKHTVTDLVNDEGSQFIRIYFESMNNNSVNISQFIAPSILDQMPSAFKFYRYKNPTKIYITKKLTENSYFFYAKNDRENYEGKKIFITQENGKMYIKPTKIDINEYESLYVWDRILEDYKSESKFLVMIGEKTEVKYKNLAEITGDDTNDQKTKKKTFAPVVAPPNHVPMKNPFDTPESRAAWDNYRNSQRTNGNCPVCGGSGKTYISERKTTTYSNTSEDYKYYKTTTTTSTGDWYRKVKCNRCNGSGRN